MRLSVAVAAVCLSLVGLTNADDVRASIRKQTNIPAQSLGSALQTLAKDRNFQIVYVSEEVASQRTAGAVGEFTPEEALKTLLKGTGLTYRYLDDKTVTIFPIGPATSGASTRAQSTSEGPGSADTEAKEGNKSIWDRFRVAQVDQGTSSSSTPVEKQHQQTPKEKSVQLEEVIVTAQKREERLQDVPIPVTAVSGDALLESNQLRLQDYFTSIPGLNVEPGQNAAPVLSIRGITTGEANPTVGVVVDDVPFGSSTFVGGGSAAPDLDPSDLQRVEVLRGPQGTLYGASSIGGLIKFVTVDPSTDGLSGRLQGGVSGVNNAGDVGYNLRGAVNVPLSDTSAVRASAFTRRDPGYIDDPVLQLSGVNRVTSEGGRVSALSHISDDLSVKLAATVQRSKRAGSPTIDQQPGLAHLQQSDAMGTGGYDRTIQTYSATVSGKVRSATLTSLTGYNINRSNDSLDFTQLFGGASPSPSGLTGHALLSDIDDKKVTQELRLSIPLLEHFDLLAGGFYAHERSNYTQSVIAQNFTTGALTGDLGDYLFNSELTEFAGFADLTYHVSDRFDIQFGGRESHITQSIVETVNAVSNPKIDSSENSFTYLVTPQFRVSQELMLYARIASGYRPGGPNYNSPALGLPPTYQPDKTQNYELGLKGNILGGALSFDASLYSIAWKDIQLALVDPVKLVGYTANGSEAKSDGAELSIEARPVAGLTIGAWAAWNDAKLTQPFPPTSQVAGADGDRLPNASRFSGSVSVREAFPIGGDLNAFVGGQISYVGDRKGYFTAPPGTRQDFPSYVQLNLQSGLRYATWNAEVFATNVTDKRGVLSGGLGTLTRTAFSLITPRTVGLNLTKTF